MLIQDLVAYYEQLDQAPESGIAQFGFAPQTISYAIVLTPDGQRRSHQPLESRIIVPKNGAPQGTLLQGLSAYLGIRTSGVRPYFLWDKSSYVLGRDVDDAKLPQKKRDRIAECHAQFKAIHQQIGETCDDPDLRAVNTFLTSWNPAEAQSLPNWPDFLGANFVFLIDSGSSSSPRYAHTSPTCRSAWVAHLESVDAQEGHCLVDGAKGRVTKTHPAIKGIRDPGGQAEKLLVSFNNDSFKSYGQNQSYNAPMSPNATFKYTTALNRLLARNSEQNLTLGDSTVVFWTDAPQPPNAPPPAYVLNPPTKVEDEGLRTRLKEILEKLVYTNPAEEDIGLGAPATGFHILSLAPNASRVVIRFYLNSTLGSVLANVRRHYADLAIVRTHDDSSDYPEAKFPSPRSLLDQTCPPKGGFPDREKTSPVLTAALLRAVLTGSKYPQALYTSVLRRTLAERKPNYLRASILKAFLVRNHLLDLHPMLNDQDPDPAYRLGRLFAVLEKIQSAGHWHQTRSNLKKGIRDTFFGSACTSPAMVFPRLEALSVHHQRHLRGGSRKFYLDLIDEIKDGQGASPRTLDLLAQGRFILGYHHQRKVLNTTKEEPSPTEEG